MRVYSVFKLVIFKMFWLMLEVTCYDEQSQPCPTLEHHSGNGEDIWSMKAFQTGMFLQNCEWQLHPPKNHILVFHLFNLTLVNSLNECSASLVLNGARLCAMPEKDCKLIKDSEENPQCDFMAESEEYSSCSKSVWKDHTIRLETYATNPLPKYQYVYFVYNYVNCSELSRKTGVTLTGKPKEKLETTTTTMTTTTSGPSTVQALLTALPVVGILIIIITVLLVIICRKRCKKKQEEKEESIYAYAGRDGISILPDATDGYEEFPVYDNVDPKYEVVKGNTEKDSNYEMVDNIIYEREKNTFTHISNAAYETEIRSFAMNPNQKKK